MIRKTLLGIWMIAWMSGTAPALRAAQSEDVVAVITEIKFNKGDIQVVHPGKTPERAAMLQSLYAGSKVQVSNGATATVVFTDGSRAVTVEEKSSPFEIQPAAKAAGRLKEAAGTLVGKKSSSGFVALAVRGKTRGPTLLAPRETKLLTATPRFQWIGIDGQPSTVKLSGVQGVIWSAENVAATQIVYPASAPALQPGAAYSWSAERRGVVAENAPFSHLGAEESPDTESILAELDAADGVSKTTLAILKGSFLISKELYYDARETLLEAVKSDPLEPTLYFLLGEVYEKTGLKALAQEAHGEAELLIERKP